MRTLIRTTIKNNDNFFVKESVSTLELLLAKKVNYIIVTKRKFNNQKLMLSERKILVKKTTITMVDRVL